MSRDSGDLVVGYRRYDERRFVRVIRRASIRTAFGSVPILGSRDATVRLPPDLECNLNGGPCISCHQDVYLNRLGWSALVEKDADVCCMDCEDRYSAEITRAL